MQVSSQEVHRFQTMRGACACDMYVLLLLQQEIGMEEYPQSESVLGGTNGPHEEIWWWNASCYKLHFGNFEVAKLRSQMDRCVQ